MTSLISPPLVRHLELNTAVSSAVMFPHNGSHGGGDKSNNYSSGAGGGNSQVCKKFLVCHF